MTEQTEAASEPDVSLDQPTTGADRLVTLDFIRGVAVLGILFANITAYAHPFLAYTWPPALPGGGNAADRWIWLFQFVFVDGKFRALFTILFGAGLVLFAERARADGRSPWLQLRRLALLLLFGFAHFALLFPGDILFTYALAGFVALLFVDMSAAQQLRMGLIWYLASSLLLALVLSSPAIMELIPAYRAQGGDWPAMVRGLQERIARTATERRAIGEGSFLQIVAYRLTEQSSRLREAPFLALAETIPLMILGMGLYRTGFFSGELDAARMRRWGWIGLGGGAIVSLALGGLAFARGFPPFLTTFLSSGVSALPALPMSLGFAALLAAWSPRAARTWLGERFVAAGRMAFSNYIAPSILLAPAFAGWGAGLFGELHRAELLVLVLIGWALMLGWSKPWLARFRYGPLEWLWRCLTYGRWFPLRR